ncbi:hypothetical protein [Actinacidiphila oryziradicis]|uniref:hypothetical protein n=1 Tax=Actinacidiphila oryziradicis TaxID=2571141 RepID=UPI0023F0E021|nr:hypothetical protein [Actinacidiphila oryziradicis]
MTTAPAKVVTKTVKPSPKQTTARPRVVTTTHAAAHAPVATCASHTVGTCAAGSPHPAGAMAQYTDGSISFSARLRGQLLLDVAQHLLAQVDQAKEPPATA